MVSIIDQQQAPNGLAHELCISVPADHQASVCRLDTKA
jgi:hypothetical protein